MVVGLVNSGIMKLTQAAGVILGANVGTTVTSWMLSLTGIESSNVFVQLLKPANFSPIVGIIGVIMLMTAKNDKKKDIGTILIGFAVLMFGMETMSSAVEPLAGNEKFTGILTMFSNPILGMLAGLVLTAPKKEGRRAERADRKAGRIGGEGLQRGRNRKSICEYRTPGDEDGADAQL